MRTFFVSENDYLVGNSKIDEEHKNLFNMLRELRLELYEDDAPKLVYEKLKDMQTYAVEHFAIEVKILSEYKEYLPLFKQHLQEHASFIKKTEEFLQRVEIEGFGIAPEVLDFLEFWFENHIIHMDKICFDTVNHIPK